jgi:hypothetical protein
MNTRGTHSLRHLSVHLRPRGGPKSVFRGLDHQYRMGGPRTVSFSLDHCKTILRLATIWNIDHWELFQSVNKISRALLWKVNL